MKSSQQFLLLALLASAVGVAGFSLANAQLSARVPFDSILASAISLGLLRFMLADYSRRTKPLRAPAALLRPVVRRTVRVSAHVDRSAA